MSRVYLTVTRFITLITLIMKQFVLCWERKPINNDMIWNTCVSYFSETAILFKHYFPQHCILISYGSKPICRRRSIGPLPSCFRTTQCRSPVRVCTIDFTDAVDIPFIEKSAGIARHSLISLDHRRYHHRRAARAPLFRLGHGQISRIGN